MVVLAKAFPESGSVADAPPPAAGSPAAETAEKLQKFGYDINGVANAQRQYRTTTLFYRKDSQAHAQKMVTDFFPGARLEPVKNNLQPKLQVTVVIGKDYVSQ